jgi:hypothetical protein
MTALFSSRVTSCSKMCIATLRVAIEVEKCGSRVGGGASWPNTRVALRVCAWRACGASSTQQALNAASIAWKNH